MNDFESLLGVLGVESLDEFTECSFDILGQDILRIVGYDEEGNALTEVVEGFHFNTDKDLQVLSQYRVFPNNPLRIWAGDESL